MPKQIQFKDIGKFMERIKSIRPDNIKNESRYEEVLDSIIHICATAFKSNPDRTTVSHKPDDLFGTSLCLEIITNVVVFEDMKELCAALSKVHPGTFEICAMADDGVPNGKVSIGIVFEDVYDLAPPRK